MLTTEDRVFLERAVEAAGLTVMPSIHYQDGIAVVNEEVDFREPVVVWNPLDDDGDAFRLLVSAQVKLTIGHTEVSASSGAFVGRALIRAGTKDAIRAAARRAVVRAVAFEVMKASRGVL